MDAGCDELECAICMDAITESTVLPCECRVLYCLRCWDRALAQSFNACGQARCPTCRGSVEVNFDADAAAGKGRLVFSRETADLTYGRQFQASAVDEAQSVSQARAAVVERLAQQTAPAMTRILTHYGNAHPFLRRLARQPAEELACRSVGDLKSHVLELGGSTAGCLEKADLITRVIESAGGPARLATHCAASASVAAEPEVAIADGMAAPHCVCGGNLERMAGRTRALRYLERVGVDVRMQLGLQLEHLISSFISGFICDLCENNIAIESYVWTCDNGQSTILHATSYDICEACFIRYAVGMRKDGSEHEEEEMAEMAETITAGTAAAAERAKTTGRAE